MSETNGDHLKAVRTRALSRLLDYAYMKKNTINAADLRDVLEWLRELLKAQRAHEMAQKSPSNLLDAEGKPFGEATT